MTNYIDNAFEWVQKKNPGQPEFHQAVKDVFQSLSPVFKKHPIFEREKIPNFFNFKKRSNKILINRKHKNIERLR